MLGSGSGRIGLARMDWGEGYHCMYPAYPDGLTEDGMEEV